MGSVLRRRLLFRVLKILKDKISIGLDSVPDHPA
jgi:hypothetical protein